MPLAVAVSIESADVAVVRQRIDTRLERELPSTAIECTDAVDPAALGVSWAFR